VTKRAAIAIFLFALAPFVVAPMASTEARAAQEGCPGQGRANAAPAIQERAMLCLVNRARLARGLGPLEVLVPLERAAAHKSGDVIRCDEFSHEACGRPFTYWTDRFGYRSCAEGENIAWGSGSYATPRAIFGMWMHSQGHRENVRGAHIWTEEFGSREC
jgi:uncharacterized protein YkwD